MNTDSFNIQIKLVKLTSQQKENNDREYFEYSNLHTPHKVTALHCINAVYKLNILKI